MGVITSLVLARNVYAYSGLGDGSNNDPYQITTCQQLQDIASDLGASYILKNNIDCSDTVNWNNGAGFAPIGDQATPFYGALDGDGYTISDLTINRPSTDYVGLFGYVRGQAINPSNIVQHFILKDVSISGQNYVGAVAGITFRLDVKEIGITGEVSGVSVVGGAVGDNGYSVLNVYSHASIGGVPSSGVGGGLVGENHGFTTDSYSTGTVPVGPGKGGLIGHDAGSGGVFNSFWDTQTSGTNVSGEGIGKTTAEMKTKATFATANWDFDTIWQIDPNINQGYPSLLLAHTTSPATPPAPAGPTAKPVTPKATATLPDTGTDIFTIVAAASSLITIAILVQLKYLKLQKDN